MGIGGSRHRVPLQYKGIDAVSTKRYPPATDLKKWSLEVCEGRQVWRYRLIDDPVLPQNPVASRYLVGLSISDEAPDLPKPVVVEDALRNAVSFFGKVQTADGHWAGDYGGPMFLLPGYAIVMHVTNTPIPDTHKLEIIRYLSNTQSADGGWGIHVECVPTVFGTALNYVVLRLLGLPRDDERCVRARTWLHSRGGAIGIPQWGKFWLAVLNCFKWEGVNSLFPEMILFPRWFPIHTYRMWSYCRTVYMPMSYIYGRRYQGPVSDIVVELREELFTEPYDKINWGGARDCVAPDDLYTPHTWLLKVAFKIFNLYEYIAPRWLRNMCVPHDGAGHSSVDRPAWALEKLYLIGTQKEDEFTNYINIGPVNQMINTLCVFLKKGKSSSEFANHLYRIDDYLWMGRDGMKMNGTNGSQLWDCAFAVQALIENPRVRDEFKDVFNKANNYLDVCQIRKNHDDHDMYFRDETKGGWPFSTRDMGWIVADCTGEGLKASLICKKFGYAEKPLSDERLFDAANILLLMQNSTGGYATCEKTRGWHFFELINASEVFGEIMIDYDYVECTSSALTGLSVFHHMYPQHRPAEVKHAIQRARDFILSIQRPDGSWEGMWGICFTYGTWFAIDGLMEAGVPKDHPAILKACEFLISKQKEDGGWGETFMSCVTREYAQHPRSQVVQTAWAVLALLQAGYEDKAAIRRGVDVLVARQQADGDWAPESILGVFNKNCMIDYSNFKNIFPMWALARYTLKYPDEAVTM